jgi:polyhydroxybutyrate depolymerase
MRNALHLMLAASIAAAGSAALLAAQRGRGEAATAASARRVTLSFQNRTREYLLYVPAAPNGSLVLAFHGGGQAAAQLQRITGLDALADREHFIVAYPEAFERSWADGRSETSAEKQGIDDVGFAKAVIEDIARTHPIDRSRVFATGLSNGAIFTHRLACEAADTFAAIAPVIGAMAKNTAASCRPLMPVAIVAIQGRADPSVAFDGNEHLQSSRATEEMWRSLNGCAPAVVSTSLPVLVRDGTSVERRSYANCRGHGDVVWYEIERGGHRWPPETVSDVRSQRENGVSSQNLNASEVIWAFLSTHARR